MTVVWKTRDGADAEDELAALSARVGDGDRNLHSEFIARARLAFGDAFDPRRMQSIDFVLVIGLLRQELLDPLQFRLARMYEIRLPFDLAFDIANQPACPSPHLAQEAHRLFVTAAVDQPADLAPRARR